ncbi:MFS transporter [Nereida sp. MMG025]|uniref:MFS transporter n=1 Tax=Nereida sp. MMG025 TaxID=2909981 RepID=UPI001F387393|nr:MFS transporter [Nereida sp. MMG025]MCF6444822.1 MFS transporter [Nereida sp. MMG025]
MAERMRSVCSASDAIFAHERLIEVVNVHERGLGLKLTLMIAGSLTIMAGATISTSLPALRDHFIDTPNVEVLARLALTLPAIVIAMVAPFGGWIVDRFGRRGVLIGACLLYAVAGGSGLWVDSLNALLVGRAFLGLAVALVMTSATALVGDYFEGSERAKFMGLQTAAASFGGLIWVTGGGFLAEIDWRAPYWIYVSTMGVALLAAAYIWEPDRSATPKQGGGDGNLWLAAGFCLLALINMATFYTVPTQLPFFMIEELGLDRPSLTGIAIGVGTLVTACIAPFYGRVASRLQLGMILAVGFGGLGMSYGLIGLAPSYGIVVLSNVGLGLFGALIWPALSLGMVAAAPAHLRGRVSGAFTACVFGGQFISPLMSQPLVPLVGLRGVYLVTGLALGCLAFGLIAGTYFRNKKALRGGRA